MVLTLLVVSCVPTQKVREANRKLPAQYDQTQIDSVNTANISWKTFFTDPELNTLIDSALANNQELNIFLQKIAIAKNEIKARKGEYLPFVNYKAGADVEKVGEYTRNGAVEKNLKIKEDEVFPEPLTNYSAGLYASWELDVCKKLRNSKKMAVMEYLATTEGKKFMTTNLVAEVASAYYELIALDNQLEILNQNLKIQENALRVVKLQKRAAQATELTVQRFEAEVLKNKSEKYEIKQQITEVENKLNFLIGKFSAPIKRNSKGFLEKQIDSLHAGIPSELLSNRPDIKRAEYELLAAKLDVKVAKANFYPSFGIKAGIGLQAFKPKYLTIMSESLLYNLGGDLVGPLINRNAIKATYSSANARQLQAVYEYEKAILNGYIEVANGLSNMKNLAKSYENKRKQVAALTKSIEVANKLYQSARADYMEILLTQRDALESKMKLVETKKEQLLGRINVYKSLGGGWK
ncbi:TolC family protein [Tenacibaculum amylolyticum]|uniref:TolC family protein n=1 Tax=Tenacibaculum amylolyticum TaxID=104269 RepID=UPI0038952EA3